MCLLVSWIFTNLHVTAEEVLVPGGCQTSKRVFPPVLCRDSVLRVHTLILAVLLCPCVALRGPCAKLLWKSWTGVRLAVLWVLKPTALAIVSLSLSLLEGHRGFLAGSLLYPSAALFDRPLGSVSSSLSLSPERCRETCWMLAPHPCPIRTLPV